MKRLFLNSIGDCLRKHQQLTLLGRFFVMVTVSQICIKT